MGNRNWSELLGAKQAKGRFVCIGLDTDHSKIPWNVHAVSGGLETPSKGVLRYNVEIIDETAVVAGAYKLNSAFYEALGAPGIDALRSTVTYIHEVAPEAPIILDAKRADIGSTNMGYVEYAFGYLGVDAITVHPYLGAEALKPFLDLNDKGIIVLCRTSNPGAGEFQDLRTDIPGEVSQALGGNGAPLYRIVARAVATAWNTNGNCAVVVGATYPEELAEVRDIVGDMPILIPGIGAQGGDLEATVKAGANSRQAGMIINNSRGIIFAYMNDDEFGPEYFAVAARLAAQRMHAQIRTVLAIA